MYGTGESFLSGKKTQGVLPPSSVLSADVCLSMCFSMPFRVCITAGIVSCLIVLWCVVVYFLLYSLDVLLFLFGTSLLLHVQF